MPRYIDADNIQYRWLPLAAMPNLFVTAEDIGQMPTADVVERKKGHWVVDEDGNIKCSECGHSGVGDNYCERCGADMREEKTDV